MSLDPLLRASPIIQAHVLAAVLCLGIGIAQFALSKGSQMHRGLGWIFVVLMVFVAASSFWIHEIRQFGDFSAIHLLSIFTLVMLPRGVRAARSRRIAAHKRSMILLFAGALLVAGAFTFFPGRIMHSVLFGR